MIRRFLVFLLLAIGVAHAQSGAPLPSGYLSVSGNQFQNGLGANVRLACTQFVGQPNDGTMTAIRTTGTFNCVTFNWRDAYTVGVGTPTFSDPFTNLVLHQNWQTGDKWGIGATFDGGVGQGGPFLGDFGSQWWVNPFNTNTAFASCGSNCYANNIYQINPSGVLELGLRPIPASMQAYINTTSLCNNPTPCSGTGGVLNYLGALLNAQNTNTQQFGYYTLQVAVDKLAGFDFQWDIESYNGVTNTNNPPEIDFEIYTNANGVMHTVLSIAGGSVLFNATSPSFDPSTLHTYVLNWQSDFITFFVDGVQQGQVATSSQPAVYSSGNPMFPYLLTAAHYHSDTNPATGSLPVFAHVSNFNVYPNTPSGVTPPAGCNSLTQIDTCVANATTAGLGVVLNHIGNEAPVGTNNPCLGKQQNGLWFDSGGSSGNDDGCGDGGNFTYSAFKADTVNLLQRYANNPTVVAYQMHATPIVKGTYTGTGTGGGGGTGTFSVNGGNVIAPDGSVFHAFGVNIDWSASSGLSPPTVAAVQAAVPKLNHIRLAIGADGGGSLGGYTDSPSFAAIESYVATFTAKGIVVMIESHYTGQPSACAVNLSGEAAWYSRLAADLKSNNLVMFESGNELNGIVAFGGGCLTQEHQNVYNAVRGTGNNTIVVLTTSDGNDFSHQGAPNGPASAYSSMSNIVWGQHEYNQEPCGTLGTSTSGGCNDQNAVYAYVASQVTQGHAYATSASGIIPTLVTEGGYVDYGNVCTGPNVGQGNQIYNCGEGQIVQAFLTPASSNVVGGDFWLWFFTGCSTCTQTNVVTAQAGSANTFYGNTVNGIISTNSPGPNTFSGGGGTGNPPLNWAGGGDTDVQAACSDVGAAVNAVNAGVIELCPGPLNNTTTMMNGAAFTTGSGSSDLSNAAAHPVTGVPANKVAYSVQVYPTNVSGVSPDSGASAVTVWNTFFGNLERNGIAPVMNMAAGCSCDGSNGNLADDQAWGNAWDAYANGTAASGPIFSNGQQPISNNWFFWGNASSNPNGTLTSSGGLNTSQSPFWIPLLYTPSQVVVGNTAWNPSDKSASVTLSNNNLTATATANTSASVRSTVSKSTGKPCFELTASTITSDWDIGLANASYNLANAGGLGTDTTGIGFDPASSGGTQGIFFNSPTPISSGPGTSSNGEQTTACFDLNNQLAWFTSSAMRGAGNNWNNSTTANPATGTGGIPFSGLTGPYFIAYNNFETGGVAVLNTTGPFAVSTPSGFTPWDVPSSAGRPMTIVLQ